MNKLALLKTAIVTWTYDVLNKEFPKYFNLNSLNSDGTPNKNFPNVYWSDTVRNRPLDATECYLDIVSDDSVSFGTDGQFIQDKDTGKWFYELTEPHEIIVKFTITSMKNERLKLTALQAQNLSYNATSYLRMQLKSGSASDYFCYDNKYLTPILVCSQNRNVSEITDISIFEDTRNRHTNQFTCKFAYEEKSRREMDLAQNIFNQVYFNDSNTGKEVSVDFYTKDK